MVWQKKIEIEKEKYLGQSYYYTHNGIYTKKIKEVEIMESIC